MCALCTKKKNTERLKFKDLNIFPIILYVDADADSGGIQWD